MWLLTSRREVCACGGILVVILVTYGHIAVPFRFIEESRTSAPSPHPGSDSEQIYPSFILHDDRSSLNGSLNLHGRSKGDQTPKNMVINGTIDYRLPWWDGGECKCDNKGHYCVPHSPELETSVPPKLPRDVGTCGRRAAADGDKQRVISISLYGKDPEYWNGLYETLSKVKILYPGWKIWLYTNPRNRSRDLCPLIREHGHLRVCDVTHLPHPLYNLAEVHPMLWRISPLGDPAVASLLVRDSDSRFSEREQRAVQEWLDSGMMFHVMRDHPEHTTPILGGMWGARWHSSIQHPGNSSLLTRGLSLHWPLTAMDLRILRNQLFASAYKHSAYGFDQTILAMVLWPSMMESVVSHDSFYCEVFPYGWRPWPTERTNGSFVGSPVFRSEHADDKVDVKCPIACRPPDHPEWIHC